MKQTYKDIAKKQINKGRYRTLTNYIVNKCMYAIKNSDKTILFLPRLHKKHVRYIEEIKHVGLNLHFVVAFSVKWDETSICKLGGDLYQDQVEHVNDEVYSKHLPFIDLYVEMNPSGYELELETLFFNLHDTVRHETEHLTQNGMNLKPSKFIPPDGHTRRLIENNKLHVKHYFILPMEIPAMIHGLWHKSRKMNMDFNQVVNNYLDKFTDYDSKQVDRYNYLCISDKKEIIDTWNHHLPRHGIVYTGLEVKRKGN